MIQTIFKKLFKLREQAARRPGADDGFDPHEKPFLDQSQPWRTDLEVLLDKSEKGNVEIEFEPG